MVRYFFLTVVVLGIGPALFAQGDAAGFSVISYNIRYDNPGDGANRWDMRKAALAACFDFYSPAVFGIQEGLVHQVQYLDSALARYHYIGVGRDDGKEGGEFSAIFYDTARLAITRQGTFWLSETPDTVSRGWDAALERICTYGLFTDKRTQRQFWVFNTHYDHRGPEARERSSELILHRVQTLNTARLPVVLTGDFNSLPESAPIATLQGEMADTYLLAGRSYGPVGTFNGFDLPHPLDGRIDYIFVSGFTVRAHAHLNHRRADGQFLSDHLPVVVELAF